MIVAKPVVDKQFWILQDGNEKVGNVEACAGGYQVKLNNTIQQYKSIKMVTQRHDIVFAPVEKTVKSTAVSDVHGYPTVGKIHNPMWDVKHKLPVYTKTNNSKSWFAAGWYEVKRGRSWKVVQDPKLITLQRYAYQGPFHSKEEANDKSIS